MAIGLHNFFKYKLRLAKNRDVLHEFQNGILRGMSGRDQLAGRQRRARRLRGFGVSSGLHRTGRAVVRLVRGRQVQNKHRLWGLHQLRRRQVLYDGGRHCG